MCKKSIHHWPCIYYFTLMWTYVSKIKLNCTLGPNTHITEAPRGKLFLKEYEGFLKGCVNGLFYQQRCYG